MRILVSWLRDFVDIAASPEEIAKTMSVRGFAVEGLEELGNDDAVIDFEVTGNRPDCMCVMGMAREIATAYGLPIRRPAARGPKGSAPQTSETNVVVSSPNLRLRWTGQTSTSSSRMPNCVPGTPALLRR